MQLIPRDQAETKVNCGTCTACCRGAQLILLSPDDNPSLFPEAQQRPYIDPYTGADYAMVVPHKDNGDCIYLGDRGCTIYGHRPKMCRVFSCIQYVKKNRELYPNRVERKQAMREGKIVKSLWDAGLERIEQ